MRMTLAIFILGYMYVWMMARLSREYLLHRQ